MFVAMPTAIPEEPFTSRLGSGGQDERLLARLVVVGAEVDGVRVDVAQHLRGDAEARLRVAVAAGGSLSIEPKLPCGSTAGSASRSPAEPHEGVVDRRVAVGVVVAHHVADDVRGLAIGRFGCRPFSYIE